MQRGVGFCGVSRCEEFARGVFLLNHVGEFHCPACHEPGQIVRERGSRRGAEPLFKEVRIEYSYDSIDEVYRDVAIVHDMSLWGRQNVYTLQSPLIRTEKRALKVAEAILANLNRCPEAAFGGGIPNSSEVVLSLDDPADVFSRKLQSLAADWERSGLRRAALAL